MNPYNSCLAVLGPIRLVLEYVCIHGVLKRPACWHDIHDIINGEKRKMKLQGPKRKEMNNGWSEELMFEGQKITRE